MSPKTQAAFEEIKRAARTGQKYIAPVTFSWLYGRAATSAAFRMAKRESIIEVAYKSAAGTPVYQPFGVRMAEEESRGVARH